MLALSTPGNKGGGQDSGRPGGKWGRICRVEIGEEETTGDINITT